MGVSGRFPLPQTLEFDSRRNQMRLSKKIREDIIHIATNTEQVWVREDDVSELLFTNPKEYGVTTLQAWLNPTLLVAPRKKLKAVFTRYCFAKLFSLSHYTVEDDLRGAKCLAMLVNKANNHSLRFLHYLLNKSPYAEAFISKSAGQALKNGYVLVSLDAPANMAVGGMIALRYGCWEYDTTSKVFNDFVAAGVDEDAAWLTCASYTILFGKFDVTYPSGGHSYIAAAHRLTKMALLGYKKRLANNSFDWSPYTLREGGARCGSIQGIYDFAYNKSSPISGTNIVKHLKELSK
jgi:hypothetical protein